MLFKLKTNIRRLLNRLINVRSVSSYPYLSGDSFRAIANFHFDQFLDFDPGLVAHGDIIFVRGNFLHDFFAKRHPHIRSPYVLISHNEDGTIGPEFEKYIDSKILHWFSENLFFKNPQATVLPIGIENFAAGYPYNFIYYFNKNRSAIESVEKQNRILFAFTADPRNQERKEADEVSFSSPLADKVQIPREEYYKILPTYKFIASPKGNGLDCHRVWEGLYMKTIPVVIRNSWSEQLAELGYPLLLIDSWKDILKMDETYLEKFYEENKAKFDTPKLYLPYWFELFANFR